MNREQQIWDEETEKRFSDGLREMLRAAHDGFQSSTESPRGITTPRLFLAALYLGKHRPEQEPSLSSLYDTVGEEETKQMEARLTQLGFDGEEHSGLQTGTDTGISSFARQIVGKAVSKKSPSRELATPLDVLVTLAEKLPTDLETRFDCSVLLPRNRFFPSELISWLRTVASEPKFPRDLRNRLRALPGAKGTRSLPGIRLGQGQSVFPSRSPADWQLFLRNQYGTDFDLEAATLVQEAASIPMSLPPAGGDLPILNTKDFLSPLTNGGPLDGLKLGNNIGAYTAPLPWHEEPAVSDDLLTTGTPLGNTRLSLESHECLRAAASLVKNTPQRTNVTPWHLAIALVSSKPTGITWQLTAQKSSLDEAAKILLSNMQQKAPSIFDNGRWAEYLDIADPGLKPSGSIKPTEAGGPSKSEQRSPESDDWEPMDSNAKRGPRSLLLHHPPDAKLFRRLVEAERNQFDEFVREANLRLSYACWNANVIAWEDTAALGDSGRSPVVTCRSVFIGFLDTGVAERQLADQGSLPAAIARASEMNSDRLTRFRNETSRAGQPRIEDAILQADDSVLTLWQHAARISHQCTEDKIVAARHLLAAFLFLYGRDPVVESQLESVEFNFQSSLALLQEHLQRYETVNHPGWRAFFQSMGLSTLSHPIQFGTGITPSRYNSLCLGIEKTSAAIAEIFKSARNPQLLPAPNVKERERVSDFVFALYGPWGRGKSTLMGQVSTLLTTAPDCDLAEGGGKVQRILTSLKPAWSWFRTVLLGYPKVTESYATLDFSAWKYPSRPEVWVHLYERIRETAEDKSFLQRLRLSFRMGLLESGWWPLIVGLILLAIPRLPLADWVGGILNASGWLGLVLIAGFFLRVSRIGMLIGRRYMKIPSHADRLGLQAVIGRDLKNLLRIWIEPPQPGTKDKELSRIDFRWLRKGWWMSVVVLALLAVSVGLAVYSIYVDHQARLEKAAAIREQEAARKPNVVSIETKVRHPLGELTFLIPASYPSERQGTSNNHVEDPYWIYFLLIGTGTIAAASGWIITRAPKRNETLLLTVDDLDRCEADQMLAVIDSLRLFLDDPEMSKRLQMAMLLDRNILQESLRTRIAHAGIKDTDAHRIREFHRTHCEKVFLCEFSMPPLQDHERDQLLKGLFPEVKLPKPASAESSTALSAESKPPELHLPNERSLSTGTTLSTASEKPPKHQSGERSNFSDAPLKTKTAPETSEQEQASLSAESDATPSLSDTSALVHAISRIPSKQLTPRSILMLKVRFELVRLLLKHQLEGYKPDDATLSGIATLLVEDLFPGVSLYAASLPKEVKAVVNQVTSN